MRKQILGVVAALLLSASAAAAPITFIFTGTGSGAISEAGFHNVAFTITATGDTDDRQSFGGGYFVDHLTANIEIDGFETMNFLTGTRTFVNNSSNSVGFSRAGSGGLDLYNSSANAAYDTWDMLSSLGPIGGTFGLLQWNNSPVITNLGALFFSSQTVTGTFQAITGQVPVPLPGTLALFGVGLLSLGLRRRA